MLLSREQVKLYRNLCNRYIKLAQSGSTLLTVLLDTEARAGPHEECGDQGLVPIAVSDRKPTSKNIHRQGSQGGFSLTYRG